MTNDVEVRSVESLIDEEYKDFSMYVIENRAIPSVIDGLKPSQRKLIYVALQTATTKKQKVAALAANLSSMANYNHGEASAQATCIGMAAKYSNNLPLLEEHGSFGSRLVQEAAAPRYIFSKLSENFHKHFTDFEVCPKNSDPDNPEPMHYLPIIPWVLVNGVRGIAVGFATNILPRNPEDLRKVMIAKASGKGYRNSLTPMFPDFRGEAIYDPKTGTCETLGVVDYKGKLIYEISEVPVGYDREKYIAVLDRLEDDNKIVNYQDMCDESGFRFEVKVNRAQRQAIDKDPIAFFKLSKRLTENLTVLDEHGHLKIFNNVRELIDYFYDYRISKCSDKIKYQIEDVGEALQKAKDKLKFVEAVVHGHIDLTKTRTKDLIAWIEKNITKKEHGKRFLSITIASFTMDTVAKLKQEIKDLEQELAGWKKTTPEDYLLNLLR